jgi:hypothetical protein
VAAETDEPQSDDSPGAGSCPLSGRGPGPVSGPGTLLRLAEVAAAATTAMRLG